MITLCYKEHTVHADTLADAKAIMFDEIMKDDTYSVDGGTYVVKQNDSMFSIARDVLGSPVLRAALVRKNDLLALKEGSVLKLPSWTYTGANVHTADPNNLFCIYKIK